MQWYGPDLYMYMVYKLKLYKSNTIISCVFFFSRFFLDPGDEKAVTHRSDLITRSADDTTSVIHVRI